MAVTKVWTINNRLNASLEYVKNKEKTDSLVKIPTLSELESLDRPPGKDLSEGLVISDLDNALKYVSQDYKTDTRHYVTGINCDGADALKEFQSVKERYEKTDGVVAYHCIQSFAPGEVDPDQAHLIGMELAAELWGNKGYQVLVCTHLDRNHIHNHFVINSVNELTGEKNPCRYHKIIAATSDRLVREHGLSVINDPGMHPLPYQKLSKRMQAAKLTVDAALSSANNLSEFINYMNHYGYAVQANPDRMYWTIQHSEWKRPVRLARLGSGYTNSEILKRIETEVPYVSTSKETLSARDQFIIQDRINRINTNWKNTAQYKYFVFMLKMGFNLNDYRVHKPSLSIEERKQIEEFTDVINYMTQNHINSLKQVEDRYIIVYQKLEYLIRQRKTQQQRLRRMVRNHQTPAVEDYKQLDDLNDDISKFRTEERILKTIEENSEYQQKSKEINIEKEI